MDDYSDLRAVADRLESLAKASAQASDVPAKVAILYDIDEALDELKRLMPPERAAGMPQAVRESVWRAYEAAREEGAKVLVGAWQDRFPLDLDRLNRGVDTDKKKGAGLAAHSIELVKKLSSKGMTDSEFRLLHHFGEKASIADHLRYCEPAPGQYRQMHRAGANARLMKRLEWCWKRVGQGVDLKVAIGEARAKWPIDGDPDDTEEL